MNFWLGVLAGILLCYILEKSKKPSGTFVMDLTDPDKDICRLEMDDSLNTIYTKKQIILNVKVYEDNSRV